MRAVSLNVACKRLHYIQSSLDIYTVPLTMTLRTVVHGTMTITSRPPLRNTHANLSTACISLYLSIQHNETE